MTEIPEHLLKRVKAIRAQAATQPAPQAVIRSVVSSSGRPTPPLRHPDPSEKEIEEAQKGLKQILENERFKYDLATIALSESIRVKMEFGNDCNEKSIIDTAKKFYEFLVNPKA